MQLTNSCRVQLKTGFTKLTRWNLLVLFNVLSNDSAYSLKLFKSPILNSRVILNRIFGDIKVIFLQRKFMIKGFLIKELKNCVSFHLFMSYILFAYCALHGTPLCGSCS